MDGILDFTVRELLRAIRERRLGAEELVRFYLERIERYDGKLNATAELAPDALRRARELDMRPAGEDMPLCGLPVLVKDNIDVAGLHTTAGSAALADSVADADAPVIANLRRAGAVILGKTNMTEFANFTSQGMPNGFSSRGGQVRSAYRADADPSGSSTGSAVAVSAGFCAAAVGTDTSFSVVVCAAANGCAGLKPAAGTLSGRGIVPISHTLDSAGAIARDLDGAILLAAAMGDAAASGVTPADPRRLRIAVNLANRDNISPPCSEEGTEALLAALRAEGAELTEVRRPFAPQMTEIMRFEFMHDLEEYLAGANAKRKTLRDIADFYREDPSRMPYGITHLEGALEASGRLDDAPYLEAMAERKLLRAEMAEELKDVDACVMTGPTNVMHVAGLPSLSVPLRMGEDGTPRGVILYGADERRLLSAALAIERLVPGVARPAL